jgi:hypothetical protein
MSLTEKCLEVHTRQTDAGPTIETIGDAGSRRSESGLRDHLDGHADLGEGRSGLCCGRQPGFRARIERPCRKKTETRLRLGAAATVATAMRAPASASRPTAP